MHHCICLYLDSSVENVGGGSSGGDSSGGDSSGGGSSGGGGNEGDNGSNDNGGGNINRASDVSVSLSSLLTLSIILLVYNISHRLV